MALRTTPKKAKPRRKGVCFPNSSPMALPPTARMNKAISLRSSVSYLIYSVSLSAIAMDNVLRQRPLLPFVFDHPLLFQLDQVRADRAGGGLMQKLGHVDVDALDHGRNLAQPSV